jgi:transcription initiation factor TFIIH subunit 1
MLSSKVAASIRGSAAYKKKDGTLSISKDQASILWIPIQTRDSAPNVTIKVTDITSMSQTGGLLPTVMLIHHRLAADTRVRGKGDAEDL